jgi:hypothetical protein
MEAQSLTISVSQDIAGRGLSPRNVPMALLRTFVRDVEEFLKGDGEEVDGGSIAVAVVEGSLGIRTEPLAFPKLIADVRRLTESQSLEGLDARRGEVIERWQRAARGELRPVFKIVMPGLVSEILISKTTDYHADDADQWVKVERYLKGEVVEIGGQKKVNAHIRLPDGKVLIVESERQVFRDDKVNRLYKPAMARIVAEYNVVTREYRNARLLSFEEHRSTLDDAQFARLTERGRKAWAEVGDVSEWVEKLRGGNR